MSSKITKALREANERINELSDPDTMSQEEALEFYESLVSDLEAKIDGVKTDIKNR